MKAGVYILIQIIPEKVNWCRILFCKNEMFYTALKIIKNNLDEITSVINSFKEGNRVKTIKL